MKPFYDKDVHFTASREELINLRLSVACYADKRRNEAETKEDIEFADKLEQLYRDLTKILESVPF